MMYLNVAWQENITAQFKAVKHGKDHRDKNNCPCCLMSLAARIKAIDKEILEGRAVIVENPEIGL